ncbi:hypothetical protein A2W32_04790 [candidate division WWE3 bacterium RBG_16_37_10]|uniref:Uncharacterized protein n=1 Tax=candidate division WWE3 bacterium RBG_16_37_10 TaxID=1802610 RepID=A0A1F4V0F0_UNCKA|nr:MAG: hypothetical protein A2W32_04790 [candidate division WWE3 bacterium RBG_16_37_10]
MSDEKTKVPLHELLRTDRAREVVNNIESMLESGELVDQYAGDTDRPAVNAEDLRKLLEQIKSAAFEEKMIGESIWLVGKDASGNRWSLQFQYCDETGYLLHALRSTKEEESAYIRIEGDFDEKGDYKLLDVKADDYTSSKGAGEFHFPTQEH